MQKAEGGKRRCWLPSAFRFAEPSRNRLTKKRPWSWVRMYEFKDFWQERR